MSSLVALRLCCAVRASGITNTICSVRLTTSVLLSLCSVRCGGQLALSLGWLGSLCRHSSSGLLLTLLIALLSFCPLYSVALLALLSLCRSFCSVDLLYFSPYLDAMLSLCRSARSLWLLYHSATLLTLLGRSAGSAVAVLALSFCSLCSVALLTLPLLCRIFYVTSCILGIYVATEAYLSGTNSLCKTINTA